MPAASTHGHERRASPQHTHLAMPRRLADLQEHGVLGHALPSERGLEASTRMAPHPGQWTLKPPSISGLGGSGATNLLNGFLPLRSIGAMQVGQHHVVATSPGHGIASLLICAVAAIFGRLPIATCLFCF